MAENGILNNFETDASDLSTGGVTQDNLATLAGSKLHDTYSTNGNPNISGKPDPSVLERLNITKYTDNLPR